MTFTKRLFSRNFFIFNLVLVGMLTGAGLSALFFLKAPMGAAVPAIKAETPGIASPETRSAVSQAEAVQNAFNWVAESTLPSIVELKVVATKAQPVPSFDNSPFRFFFNNPDGTPEDRSPEFRERGLGSGVIVERRGATFFVLTNNHVAGEADTITVIGYNGKEYEGKLLGTDARKDLAVVSFESKDTDLKVASLGESSKLKVGDWVLALGSPLGLEFSVTSGIVSALHRSGGPDNNISDFIQTDASINQGNSGGALVNIRGEVVGINTWIASPSGGNVGLGFSVPIDNAKKVISDLIEKKAVKYGWLGVSLMGLDESNAEELAVKGRKGAFVGNVFIDSPAAKGGFLPGDFVIEADGKKVDDTRALTRYVGDMPAGKDFRFKIVRLGKETVITVRIGERDEKAATDNAKLWPGIDLLSLKSENLDSKKLEGKTGLFVAGVQAKSPAQSAGIKSGDIILKVNGKVVANMMDFYKLLNEPGVSKFTFAYERDGSEFETAAYTKK